MTQSAWAIDIDRDDVTRTETVPADTSVGHGEILVQIDSYAMTANNVTYAVFGKPSGLFGRSCGCVRKSQAGIIGRARHD